MYEVIIDGDEAGVWLGNRQVVSAWALQQRGLTVFQVCKWSQKAIANLVYQEQNEPDVAGFQEKSQSFARTFMQYSRYGGAR